jgi:EmrB/QacA subfamily drug resistance transporter
VRLAIPAIHRELGLSPESEQWVANAYMLTFGSLLLLGGRVADLVGRRRMLLAGVGVFTLASLACGLAPSSSVLIGARAVQGLGAAAMTPAALSILMRTFPEGAERNKAIGVWAAAGGIGATAAWIIGGPLIDGPGWAWVFWINVPIGAAIAALAVALLPESRDSTARREFDVAGALSVTAALGVLVYAVVDAPNAGWASTRTAALFAASLALFAAFVAIERRTRAPLVPRAIARSRTLIAANVGLAFAAASIYGMSFVLALYGQQVLGYSALQMGFAGFVLPLGAAVGAGLGQALVTRRGSRPASVIGLTGLAIGFVLLQRMPVDGSYVADLLPPLLVFGPSLGFAFTSFSIATLEGVAGKDAGLASGLNNTFENVGGALGTAVMGSVAATRTGELLHTGAGPLSALNDGFQLAFAVAIAFPILGLVASAFIRRAHAPVTITAPERATVTIESLAEQEEAA